MADADTQAGRAGLSRTPPAAVRRELRREVGFGCPIPGCGNPYLEYHHFDPPWEVEHHHDPTKMIALCATHHAKAEAWTEEQLRALKQADPSRPEVKGRFEWMRRHVLAVVGGNYFYETPNIVVFRGEPMIWFRRDEEGSLLLNVRMLTASGQPRTRLLDNDWFLRGDPADVESPPNGSLLWVRYANGDSLRIRFRPFDTGKSLAKRFPQTLQFAGSLQFPLITAEVNTTVAGTRISFGPNRTTVGGATMTGCFAAHCQNGFVFG